MNGVKKCIYYYTGAGKEKSYYDHLINSKLTNKDLDSFIDQYEQFVFQEKDHFGDDDDDENEEEYEEEEEDEEEDDDDAQFGGSDPDANSIICPSNEKY